MTRAGAATLALFLMSCGPGPEAIKARARVIPAAPSGPVWSSVGVVSSTDGRWVVLDHEGAPGSGLPPGRTRFRTWGEVVAEAPGEPGSRVAIKVQKLGDGWALVEMTGRK
jgi:hypothetical protein